MVGHGDRIKAKAADTYGAGEGGMSPRGGTRLSRADRFKVNAPGVAWEDFDGETVIVNLETGEYFSTGDVGAEIWRRLAACAPVAAVEEALLAQYDVEPGVATASLSTFLASLREHGLLVPASEPGPAEPEAAPVAFEKRAFQPPSLEMYSDMQDLLLLDPIHETSDPGVLPNDPGVLPNDPVVLPNASARPAGK